MILFRLFGVMGLMAVLTLSFTACSKSDEPVAVEEEVYMEGTLPKNIHVGMLYPVSHDKKTDKCTFKLYLGENPPQELIDALELGTVNVLFYDRYGDIYDKNYYGFQYDPVTGTNKDGLNTWITEKMRTEFRHENTITLSCAACELIAKFRIKFSVPALFEYYPELLDLDNVEPYITTWPEEGVLEGGTINQSWSSPHHWYF